MMIVCVVCETTKDYLFKSLSEHINLVNLPIHLYDNHLLSRTLIADYFDTHHSDNMIDLQI